MDIREKDDAGKWAWIPEIWAERERGEGQPVPARFRGAELLVVPSQTSKAGEPSINRAAQATYQFRFAECRRSCRSLPRGPGMRSCGSALPGPRPQGAPAGTRDV